MQSAPVGNGKSFLWQQCSSSSRQQNIVELYSCLAKSHKSSVHFANSWTVPKICGCQSGSFGKCGERVYTKLLIRTVGTGDIVLAVSQAKRLNKDDLTYQVLRITIIVCHALQSDCMVPQGRQMMRPLRHYHGDFTKLLDWSLHLGHTTNDARKKSFTHTRGP